MGTSSDFKGGTGGDWTPFKHAATSFAKHGPGDGRLDRLVARLVLLLGGAAGGARAARSGIGGAQRLGDLAAGLAGPGLDATLERLGLGHLVGQARLDVVGALIDLVGGPGGDQEATAARLAACDVIDELFAEGEPDEPAPPVELDRDGVVDVVETFLARYVYYRLIVLLEDRLTRLATAQESARLERELRDHLRALIRLDLRDRDPLAVDWEGEEGRAILDDALRAGLTYAEAVE